MLMPRRVPTYYELLGVSPSATGEEIHTAYRRLARRYHPDVNAGGDAGDRFQQLSDAYEVLHDPQQRARYDRSTPPVAVTGRGPVSPQPPFFSARRSRFEVPRFLDEEPAAPHPRLMPRVRVRFTVRWLNR